MFTKIALIGQQCSGKTSAANFFMENFEYCYPTKIADPIYKSIKALMQPKHRAFMQEFGDVAKKHFGNEIFAEVFEMNVQAVEVVVQENGYNRDPNKSLIICDDIRFQFELDRVKRMGFAVVSIAANPEVRKARSDKLGLDFLEGHNSETEVPSLIYQADFTIVDNGITMDQLKAHCNRILKNIHIHMKHKIIGGT